MIFMKKNRRKISTAGSAIQSQQREREPILSKTKSIKGVCLRLETLPEANKHLMSSGLVLPQGSFGNIYIYNGKSG